jgi:hypothetical protein
VLGCCCLQWSHQLGRLPTDNPAAAAAAIEPKLPHSAKGVFSILPTKNCSVWGTAVEGIWGGNSLIQLCLMVIAQWLAVEGNWPALEEQSSDNLEAIISAIMACHRVWQSVRDTAKEQPDAPVPLGGYVQELSALGEALCSVSHKLSCNNPVCSNVLGPSELQLLKGRSNTCSGCRMARYCSPKCMRQHWKQHRPICKRLERTAAAAAVVAAKVTAPEAAAAEAEAF